MLNASKGERETRRDRLKSGVGNTFLRDCRGMRDRANESAIEDGEILRGEDIGSPRGDRPPLSSTTLSIPLDGDDLPCLFSVGEGLSAAVGGMNVSAPRDVRRPKRLLLRLFSFECEARPPPTPCFVGVGGSSSLLDWLSI